MSRCCSRSKEGWRVGRNSYRRTLCVDLYSPNDGEKYGNRKEWYESRNIRGVLIGKKYYGQCRKYYAKLTVASDS